MNKVLISILGLVALAGCSSHFDYYKGGVRYTQEGTDCVYYSAERGNRFSSDVAGLRDDNRVVYRNTLCADLYARDTAGEPARQDRKVLTQAAEPVKCNSCNTCNTCAKTTPVVTRRYYVIAGM